MSRISELLKGSAILGAALSISLLNPCVALAAEYITGPVTVDTEPKTYDDDVVITTTGQDDEPAYGFYVEESQQLEFKVQGATISVSSDSSSADSFGLYAKDGGELEVYLNAWSSLTVANTATDATGSNYGIASIGGDLECWDDFSLSINVSATTSGSNYGIYNDEGYVLFGTTHEGADQLAYITVSGSTAVGGIGFADDEGHPNSAAAGNVGIFINGGKSFDENPTTGDEEDPTTQVAIGDFSIYVSGEGSGYGVFVGGGSFTGLMAGNFNTYVIGSSTAESNAPHAGFYVLSDSHVEVNVDAFGTMVSAETSGPNYGVFVDGSVVFFTGFDQEDVENGITESVFSASAIGSTSENTAIKVTNNSAYTDVSQVILETYAKITASATDYGLVAIALDDGTGEKGGSNISLSAIDSIAIEAKEGIFAFAREENAIAEVTATIIYTGGVINIIPSEVAPKVETAVTSVSSSGGASNVELVAETVNVTATNAFVAVIDHQEAGDDNKVSSNSADSDPDPTNCISVRANALNVNADEFVALAYTDYSSLDGSYEEGISQIDLNLRFTETSDIPIVGSAYLNGNVFAAHGSIVNIGLGEDSEWTGFAQDSRVDVVTHTAEDGSTITDDTPGEITVYANQGGVWNVRPINGEHQVKENSDPYEYTNTGTLTVSGTKSYITTWYSYDFSGINLDLTGSGVTYNGSEYQPVDIMYLKGTGTVFMVHTDIDGARGEGLSTDQAIIHSGEGSHYINVSLSGSGESQEDYLILHLEEEGATSVQRTLTKDGKIVESGSGLAFSLMNDDGEEIDSIAQGLYKYGLVTRDAQETDGTEWYLTRMTGGKAPDSNEGRAVTALAGTSARLSMHYAWLEDLRKRLGEVRYGAQDGLWAKFIYQRDSGHGTSSTGFRQDWYGLDLGLDHIVAQDTTNMWLLGGNFKSGHGSQKVRAAKGKGNLNTYGINFYGTYANQYGCYADLVLSLDKYHQKIGVKTENGGGASGRFNSWGWGVSVEVGKMFSFKLNNDDLGPWDNHWWIEPQAQLSYYWTNGKNWAMSDGMAVDQKNGQSLVGRLGVVVGKQWSYGGADKADKRSAQVYLKGGVKHEFLGKQDTSVDDVLFDKRLRGTSGYYGAGVDWHLSKRVKAYAQVERDAGGKYRKDIEASIGLKWQF